MLKSVNHKYDKRETIIQKGNTTVCLNTSIFDDTELSNLFNNLSKSEFELFTNVHKQKGITKCLETDEFDEVVGKKIASCKCQLDGLNQVYLDLVKVKKILDKCSECVNSRIEEIKHNKIQLKENKKYNSGL